MMPNRPTIIAILAGGMGTRIGGTKHLRLLAGRPLIHHMVDLARHWGEPVVILRDLTSDAGIDGVTKLADADGIEGPLAGLVAGLHYARAQGSPRMMLLPVDTPLLPPDLLPRLHELLDETGHGCAVPQCGGHLHMACSLWDCSATLSEVDSVKATGMRSIKGLAQKVGMSCLDIPDENAVSAFLNINDNRTLFLAEEILSDGRI